MRDGSSAAPTLQTCTKDQPGHLKLKLRKIGQNAPEEMQLRSYGSETGTAKVVPFQICSNLITGDSDVEFDSDNNNESDLDESTEMIISEDKKTAFEGIEDELDEDEELLIELEKIRREREAEKVSKSLKESDKDPHSVLSGNPLFIASNTEEDSAFGAKKRWDSDIVFKNQAKGLEEKPQKRFINDTTRSDFHRRFMDKFIK